MLTFTVQLLSGTAATQWRWGGGFYSRYAGTVIISNCNGEEKLLKLVNRN